LRWTSLPCTIFLSSWHLIVKNTLRGKWLVGGGYTLAQHLFVICIIFEESVLIHSLENFN
jgi:hypothetical protein